MGLKKHLLKISLPGKQTWGGDGLGEGFLGKVLGK